MASFLKRKIIAFLVLGLIYTIGASALTPTPTPNPSGLTDKQLSAVMGIITNFILSDNSTQDSTIKGLAYNGIISNALIEVYDFTDNTKGELLSSGIVIDSSFTLNTTTNVPQVLIEIKKNSDNTAYYIDEATDKQVIFNNLILKSIIVNAKSSEEYIVTPLTTLATELVINKQSPNINSAYETISRLFGLSFSDIHITKPNIENLLTSSLNTKENEYSLALLSMSAYLSEINKSLENDISMYDLISIILKDLKDGIFDGKENDDYITISNGSSTQKIGDVPFGLSKYGKEYLITKNISLYEAMKSYFLRLKTASRAVMPPIVDIKANNYIAINKKTIFSAEGSFSEFGYPLTYVWSIVKSPLGATASFSSLTDMNSFLSVNTEGNYTISLEVNDGHNTVKKDMNITADLDGDGILAINDLDLDGDGVLNINDKFPNNPAEFLDYNGDGIGNFAEKDEDGDGIDDIKDDYPFDNTKSTITIFTENEFNGNLNVANTLSGQMPYKVSGVINANGSDDDYFKFTSTQNEIISVKLTKNYEIFEPIISVVDNQGNPIPSISSITSQDISILSFRIPLNGTFGLIVTDKNSNSDLNNTYIAEIFIDSDIDGVSDSYEDAIGSNKNLSDTDGDGIKDYYEIHTSNFDIDNDGIPNWLDDDSDNDTIPDKYEVLTDYDNDGLFNPYDTDSDGNSILDSIEMGTNPLNLLDEDNDGYADYNDDDDDNDGILDINDNDRLLPADINTTDTISIKGIIDGNKISNLVQSEGTIEITGSNFSSDSIVILVHSDKVYNLTPSEVTNELITVQIPNIKGPSEISIYSNNKLTANSDLKIVNIDSPIIFRVNYPNNQDYALENDVVTLSGINLSSMNTVKINNKNINVLNSSNESISFSITSELESGKLTVLNLNDESNGLPIFIGRTVTGTVTLPQGSIYDFSDLKVSFAGNEFDIDNSGVFSVVVKNNDISSINIFTPEDNNGNISMYLSKIILRDDIDINVDINSTANNIMFFALNAFSQNLVENKKVLEIIQQNNNLFADNLASNLGSNTFYISNASDEYISALSGSKIKIYNLLNTNGLIQKISLNKSGFLTSIPVGEIDDVSVFKEGDPINGKIRIDNDTMVFLDYMIQDISSRKIIKDYLNQFYGSNLIGPQNSSFFLYYASESTYDVLFKSCKVTVLSPKFKGMSLSNFNKAPEYKLALRTVLSQGIFPIVNEVIGYKMPEGIQKIFLEKVLVPAINGRAIDDWREGKIGSGFIGFSKDLVQALGTDYIKNILKSKIGLDAKAIANFATHIIGLAVPTKTVGLAGTTWDIGKTVIDFATIEDKMEFNVDFPILIENIYPTSIKKDGKNKKIYIEGRGLEKFCSNYDTVITQYFPYLKYKEICATYHSPKVKFTRGGETIIDYLTKESNNKYSFKVPSTMINNSSTENITVQVIHKHLDTQYFNELTKDITVDAPKEIQIVDKLTISTLTPDSGGTNSRVTISGTGFSNDKFSNKVYFSSNGSPIIATTIEATESQLIVSVPQGTITGDVFVVVDNEESNHLLFTISSKQLTIQFGDNGSINDDTFSLELNGKTIKTMPSPTRAAYGIVELVSGQIYTINLKGITAPDDIGTYYIQFPSEIEVISGDNLSGNDLTAGVVKSWQVRLKSNIQAKQRIINRSASSSLNNEVKLQPEIK